MTVSVDEWKQSFVYQFLHEEIIIGIDMNLLDLHCTEGMVVVGITQFNNNDDKHLINSLTCPLSLVNLSQVGISVLLQ